MELLEEIHQEILNGHPQETRELVSKALAAQIEPERIVNDAILSAMRRVGELVRSENMDIVRLLAAAKCVCKGFEVIEAESPYQKKMAGTVLLGTVEGDLHDVGKNLVALMFRSEGIHVIDLGVDVSERTFLKAVKEHPDISLVCISSLLTTSVPELVKIVKALKKVPGRKYKIMIGGGAVTEEIAKNAGADAYTADAVDAAILAKKFLTQENET